MSSCVLLVASLSGGFFRIPNDLPWSEQTLRPWFLINLIFTSYTFLTSIFYWLDLNGWRFDLERSAIVTKQSLLLAASAQYFYLVAHVGFLLGLSLVINWVPKLKTAFAFGNSANFYIKTAAIGFVAMFAFRYIPGLSQFEVRAKGIFTVAAAISLGVAYQNKSQALGLASFVNFLLVMLALASGWKEEVLVLVILNSVTFYPVHPRWTATITGLVFVLGFVVLPPISNQIREETWSKDGDQFASTWNAVAKVAQKPAYQLIEESWVFLAGRLSEQGLFVRYLKSVPEQRPFYGDQIIRQAITTPVPRLIWPSKENTERLVHRRVVENGVVSETSKVSAKPQYVVDGYLSFGGIGVFVSALIYGIVTQLCSALCESRLGGYLFGGVMFNGLFALLWRGNCWEFTFNNLVWSIITAFLIGHIGRSLGWFVPVANRLAAQR